MSSDPSFGMGGFLQGMLGDLLKMVHTDAPIQWEMLMQFAQSVANDGDTQANPDPIDRIHLEQFLRIAELHVADVTGMTVTPAGTSLSISTVGRADWARHSLDGWRPLIEAIAIALKPEAPSAGDGLQATGEDGESRDFDALIAQWTTAISPMMLSMQIGSVVGRLSRRVLSQYELLLPRGDGNELVVVPGNLRGFAQDWSLSYDDLALWLVADDITIHSILSRRHVSERLFELLVRHAEGFRTDPSALENQFGDVSMSDMSDLSDLSKLLGDPAALRQVTETPELAAVRRQLSALTSTIEGYAEWVTSAVVERVSGNPALVREALRRHRVERGEEARTADLLFGLAADQSSLDRGESFVRGVIERGGEHELARLWVVERDLPTPSEVEAPGLWLERVNLPDTDGQP